MSLTETVEERETELTSLVIDHIGDYAIDFAPQTNNVTMKLTKVVLGNPSATLTLSTWSIKKPANPKYYIDPAGQNNSKPQAKPIANNPQPK
ncbi:hypothetical protein ACTHGU_03600 [Chitinophagaceae bacterium MMS25-I14]